MVSVTRILLAAAALILLTGSAPAVQGLTPITPFETGFATFYGDQNTFPLQLV